MTKEEYQNYLRGSHWKKIRDHCQKAKSFKTCVCCKEKTYDIHHLTYKTLGREKLKDLIPLCRNHHFKFHEWLWENSDFSVNDVFEWANLNKLKIQSDYNFIKLKKTSTKAKKSRAEKHRDNNIKNLKKDFKKLLANNGEIIPISRKLAERLLWVSKFCKNERKITELSLSKTELINYYLECFGIYNKTNGTLIKVDEFYK